MACLVFGLRKCRSRMATVNSSLFVPYLSDSIGVTLAKSNCTRLCMLQYPANTLIGGGPYSGTGSTNLVNLFGEVRARGRLQPLVR
jgi:hypothetical protein